MMDLEERPRAGDQDHETCNASWIALLYLEEWGYTGSACVGMALDSAIEQGKVHKGDLVVLIGSGVGYNQAGVAFRM
jgi:3-oxoacyl-[acyl-carrier-protein] synthase III